MLSVPFAQHIADHLALQVFLAAAQVAGDDGEIAVLRPALGVFFRHIGEWADHHVLAVVAHELGGHGLHDAAVEHVEHQGLHDVVAVVAQGHLVAAQLVGHLVQDGTAQARAQAAGGLALGHHALDDAVGVLVFDVEIDAYACQVLRQHMLGETGLLLVKVDGYEVELDRCAGAQLHQDVEQGVAVLAAGHADHHLVAVLDHVVVANGAGHFAAQALFQLVVLALDLQALLVRDGIARLAFGLVGLVVKIPALAGGSLQWCGVSGCVHGVTIVRFRCGLQLRNRQKSPAWQS
ncbi:hypothetical protein D3C72_1488470 [compost metagenome]